MKRQGTTTHWAGRLEDQINRLADQSSKPARKAALELLRRVDTEYPGTFALGSAEPIADQGVKFVVQAANNCAVIVRISGTGQVVSLTRYTPKKGMQDLPNPRIRLARSLLGQVLRGSEALVSAGAT